MSDFWTLTTCVINSCLGLSYLAVPVILRKAGVGGIIGCVCAALLTAFSLEAIINLATRIKHKNVNWFALVRPTQTGDVSSSQLKRCNASKDFSIIDQALYFIVALTYIVGTLLASLFISLTAVNACISAVSASYILLGGNILNPAVLSWIPTLLMCILMAISYYPYFWYPATTVKYNNVVAYYLKNIMFFLCIGMLSIKFSIANFYSALSDNDQFHSLNAAIFKSIVMSIFSFLGLETCVMFSSALKITATGNSVRQIKKATMYGLTFCTLTLLSIVVMVYGVVTKEMTTYCNNVPDVIDAIYGEESKYALCVKTLFCLAAITTAASSITLLRQLCHDFGKDMSVTYPRYGLVMHKIWHDKETSNALYRAYINSLLYVCVPCAYVYYISHYYSYSSSIFQLPLNDIIYCSAVCYMISISLVLAKSQWLQYKNGEANVSIILSTLYCVVSLCALCAF